MGWDYPSVEAASQWVDRPVVRSTAWAVEACLGSTGCVTTIVSHFQVFFRVGAGFEAFRVRCSDFGSKRRDWFSLAFTGEGIMVAIRVWAVVGEGGAKG